jgi:hypothetical protein
MSRSKSITYDKYPSTPYLPFTSEKEREDKYHPDISFFENREVLLLEKMDGENCVAGNTVVQTEDGEMTIAELCESEYAGKVLSYSPQRGVAEMCEVVGHSITENENQWFKLTTESGEELILTGDHMVFLPRLKCYRRVKNLEGDEKVLVNA